MPAMMPTRTMLTSKNLLDTDTQSALSAVSTAQGNAQAILDTHIVTVCRLPGDAWGARTAYSFYRDGQKVAEARQEMSASRRECWLTDPVASAAEFSEWDYREAAQAYRAAQKGAR
jgi:hypothetical protein